MKYTGKLYGKVNNKFIELDETAENIDELKKQSQEKTDLEKFISLYKQIGIELTPAKHEDKIWVKLGDENSLYLDGEKFAGHLGFFSIIEFSSEGKFICQGFWE